MLKKKRGNAYGLKQVYGCSERGHGMMAVVEVTEEHAEVRTEWRWKIRCGDP